MMSLYKDFDMELNLKTVVFIPAIVWVIGMAAGILLSLFIPGLFL